MAINNQSASKNPNLQLLKLVSEEGFLDKLKKKFTKAGAAAEPEDTEGGRAKADTTTSQDSQLELIAGEAAHGTTGETRYVIYLRHKDLDAYYLKQGGGGALVDALEDDEIKAFVENPTFVGPRIRQLGKNFSFRDQIAVPVSNYTRNANTAVIIDVPKQLASQLDASALVKSGTDTLDMSAAKAVLKKMMSHKYYVMTLNVAEAKKIAPQIDDALNKDDLTALKKAFDPKVIVNYPIKQVRVAAQNEWDDLQGGSSDKEEEEEKPESSEKKPAEPSKPGEAPAGEKDVKKPAEKTDLNHLELVSQMNDLWTTWRAKGESVTPELRDFIMKMADEVKAKPEEGKTESLLKFVNSKPL